MLGRDLQTCPGRECSRARDTGHPTPCTCHKLGENKLYYCWNAKCDSGRKNKNKQTNAMEKFDSFQSQGKQKQQ